MQNVRKFLNKKVLLASGMLVFAAAAVAGFTGAFFSDTETSNQNVFQAGTLDLEVGIESDSTIGDLSLASLTGNEALFNFQGLIPGASDSGFFKLRSNVDAWACVAPTMDKTYENDRLAPEASAGDVSTGANSGELQNFLQVAMWTDVNENGTYEDGTDTDLQVADISAFDGTYLTLLDSSNADYMEGNDRREVGFQYCFGAFTDVNNPAAGCDGSNPDTNQAQTDSVEVSFEFVGMQHANNPSFTCDSLNPIPEPEVVAEAWDATGAAGLRLKGNNSGNEFYLGIPDLGTGSNRNEAGQTWIDGEYEVLLAYVAGDNKITATVTDPSDSENTVEYDFDTELSPVCAVGDWDEMQIQIANRKPAVTLDFNGVELGGFALGDFTSVAEGGWYSWTVSEFDFASSWELTGTLDVANFNDNENNKIEILVGCSV